MVFRKISGEINRVMLCTPPLFTVNIPHLHVQRNRADQINSTSMSKLLSGLLPSSPLVVPKLQHFTAATKGLRPPPLLLLMLGKQPKLLPSRSVLAELPSSPSTFVFVQKVKDFDLFF